MIPRRIQLRGFLSYRDEQVLDFTESRLWMLSGANGSGKSAIFDALTYALYGCHRGGSTGATELIHKNSESLLVELEFELEGRLYRIRRTLTKRGQGRATQQIWAWTHGKWEAVADSQRAENFKHWIQNHVGLKYDAFTSSVLLLQGRAEKLIESKAKERAEILAQIVDLSRYRKLFEAADAERKDLKQRVDSLENQIEKIPEVSPEQLQAAEEKWQNLEAELRADIKRREELAALKVQADHWTRVQDKLRSARQQLQQAEQMIQEGQQLEADWNRLQSLRTLLPTVESILALRWDIARARDEMQTHEKKRQALKEKAENKTLECDLEVKKFKKIEQDMSRVGELLQKAENRYAELRPALDALQKLSVFEERLQQLQKDELDLPRNLTQQLDCAQRDLDNVLKAEASLPILRSFAETRRHISARLADIEQAEKDAQLHASRQRELQGILEVARQKREQADQLLRTLKETLAARRALADQRRIELSEFNSLEGAKTCRLCGQPLTPDHWQKELAAREQALRDAQKELQTARSDVSVVESDVKQLEDECARTEGELRQVEESQRSVANSLALWRQELTRLRTDRERRLNELAPEYRRRIAEFELGEEEIAGYPTDNDLEQLKNLIATKSKVQREVEHLKEAQLRANRISLEIDRCKGEIEKIRAKLPDDPAKIRSDGNDLEREIQVLRKQFADERVSRERCQRELDNLTSELQKLRESLGEIDIQIARTEERLQNLLKQQDEAVGSLPTEWQKASEDVMLSEVMRLKDERQELERRQTELRYQDYQKACATIDSIRKSISDSEAELKLIPEEACRNPEDLQAEMERTTQLFEQRTRESQAAHAEWQQLQRLQEQRTRLQSELNDCRRELQWSATLAELLGRDRLQRHLVRRAERQIVDFANAVLDRLSGGTIYLRIVGNDDVTPNDEALLLEAVNRVSGEKPIPVDFLSGSQRFRVAVSLALGLGQFANQTHRPIESIIIDEGFGCLDREGRQSMIQELHQLRDLLRCIILVSHQEEFAAAFADGYHFELRDGTTVVERVHR
jgi:exonuclease SbcC